MSSIKEELKRYAEEIGIDLFGVTSPEPFDRYLGELEKRNSHYQERYSHRIETWKNLADPKGVMEDAKSVVVIGFYFLTPDVYKSDMNGRFGRIVSLGHLGILKRVKLISRFLKKLGYKTIIGAHRKEAAVRAGLGAIGKNGLVINKTYGSWVAYQSVITNAKMEYDIPFEEDLCGKCDKCMKACPLYALYEPYRLNPQCCICYLLTSKEVPASYWEKMHNYIMGCDICQEVCPKNEVLKPKEYVESILPDFIGINPTLEILLDMDEDVFQKQVVSYIQSKISNSVFISFLLRYKLLRNLFVKLVKNILKGKEVAPETFYHVSDNLLIYKRNAIIAAGNSGNVKLRPYINKFTEHPFLQKYAKWAMERIG